MICLVNYHFLSKYTLIILLLLKINLQFSDEAKIKYKYHLKEEHLFNFVNILYDGFC